MTKPKTPLAIVPAAPAADPAVCPPTSAEAPEDPCAPPPEVYDPADYRWVPVRRRARYDGWTEEKQRRFIDALADTGQVRLAAKAVGLSSESAYKLRRQPHAAAFARAWEAARVQAGSFLEDVAFERALEGVEHNVYDEYGQLVCTKRVFNDRLLMFLLRNLKPERYARHALATLTAQAAPPGETIEGNPGAALIDSLAALEPPLPAPADALLDHQTLDIELEIADISDGSLSQFLSEQRPEPSTGQRAYEAALERIARGKAADAKIKAGEVLTDEEYHDSSRYYDPAYKPERGRKRFR